MKSVHLTPEVNQHLIKLARENGDREICGFIGRHPNGEFQIYEITNVAGDSRRLFEMDPAQQIAAMKTMREQAQQLYAIYHSHPTSPAMPSLTDMEQAAYPEVLYLIISLATSTPEVRGF
ncbi:MAG: M67 family peptidase, partial [Gammaproteobacteria bacterium]